MARTMVILVALVALGGCIYEADRDLGSLNARATKMIVEEGCERGAPVAVIAATTGQQLSTKLGPPDTEEPLTVEAAERAITGSKAGMEKDAAFRAKLVKYVGLGGAAIGIPMLGGIAAFAVGQARKLKRMAKTVVEVGETGKDLWDNVQRGIKDAKAVDGKVDLAEILKIGLEQRDKLGPLIQGITAARAVGAEVKDAWDAKKNGG